MKKDMRDRDEERESDRGRKVKKWGMKEVLFQNSSHVSVDTAYCDVIIAIHTYTT